MEAVEYGAVVILALVLYAVVDKALVPLIKGRKNGNGGISSDAQRYINEDHKRRIEQTEEDLRAVRDTLSVSRVLLERIEKQISEYEA